MQKSRSANLGWAFLRGLLSIILLLSCSVALRAQSTYGSLTGTVVDSDRRGRSWRIVTLTNTGTASSQTQPTGDTGCISFVT